MNDTKKEILYMIGLLYEKQGKKGESLAAFQQIYDADVYKRQYLFFLIYLSKTITIYC